MSVETVARRYAGALADVVTNAGEAEAIKTELKAWQEMFETNHVLHSAFHNPAIAHNSKERVLESLIAKTNPSKTTANFLRVLLKNNRLIEISTINEKLDAVLEARNGVISASVTSARVLTEAEKAELRASLAKVTGGTDIRLDFEIDESVIGGSITRVGSTVY
ncbi:MAG: ATP synthase F1 subunit delta, partial [Acidobacteria bacterium]|nr:ATP synthase F1 subunit delta [Acidobacteriota bacterium]